MLKTARYYKIAAENKELKEHIKRQRDNAINTLSPEEKDSLMNMSSVEAYDYLNKIK